VKVVKEIIQIIKKVIDRTVQSLDISRSFLNKILEEEPVELNENL
jgi:hypothetical protein